MVPKRRSRSHFKKFAKKEEFLSSMKENLTCISENPLTLDNKRMLYRGSPTLFEELSWIFYWFYFVIRLQNVQQLKAKQEFN